MAVTNVVAVALALVMSDVVESLRHGGQPLHVKRTALAVCVLAVWATGSELYRMHSRNGDLRKLGLLQRSGSIIVAQTVVLALIALTMAGRATRDAVGPTHLAVSMLLVALLVTLTTRLDRAIGRRRVEENAVIVGAGDVGQLVARKLLRHPEYGIRLIGFVDTAPRPWRKDVEGVPVVGRFDDLLAVAQATPIDRVILAFSRVRDEDMLERVRSLLGLNIRVDVVPRLFDVIGLRAGLPSLEGIPIVPIKPRRPSVAALRVKRVIDLVGACLMLAATLPLFIWAAWRIPRESPGPVFFRQTRLGAGMKEFTMLKFRTMAADTDQSLHRNYIRNAMVSEDDVGAGELYKLDYGDQITATGRWLRRSSLDELPQLLNVIQGTMSLVGPRPCLAYETEYFSEHHRRRFEVRPGLTGVWQVTARANASFSEALDMDAAYVRDWSLWLDMSLLARTPSAVLRQRGATV
jgi:exopolysaccharide biosynthesis polyprenyl glycosylphosphotransferase